MTSLKSPEDIYRYVDASRHPSNQLQVLGVGRSHLQLFIQEFFARQSRPRRMILCVPRQRDFGVWSFFLEGLERDFQNIEASILPRSVGWGSDRLLNRDLAKRQRLEALALMTMPKSSSVLVTTLPALAQKTLPPHQYQGAMVTIAKGDEWALEDISSLLLQRGYELVDSVVERGQYAIRGGVVDVFSPGMNHPIRLELFADQIENLREFSVETQRSSGVQEKATITPAAEYFIYDEARDELAQRLYEYWLESDIDQHERDGMLRSFRDGLSFPAFDQFSPLIRRESASFWEYLGSDDLIVLPQGAELCENSWRDFCEASLGDCKVDRSRRFPVMEFEDHFALPKEEASFFEGRRTVEFGAAEIRAGVDVATYAPFPVPATLEGSEASRFDYWVEKIQGFLNSGAGVVLLCQTREHVGRLGNLLKHRDIVTREIALSVQRHDGGGLYGDDLVGQCSIALGEIEGVCWARSQEVLLIPDQAIFGRKARQQRSSSKRLQNYLSSFKELKVGALVVHLEHGIGRYRGLVNLKVAGSSGDFLHLEYAGGDKVYLPVDRLSLLQRYNSGSDTTSSASLDKLKGQGWEKRKSRVRRAVRDMADELLKIQASRSLSKGVAHSPLSADYFAFENSFPYVETEDQLRAISDVNSDMTNPKTMDRLVCGDVGFGKTEVALRAAYRAVLDGYQVLVLVPTTVLCYQHFRTFLMRMEKLGVRVAQVNRFVRGLEMKEAIAGLEQGKIDILIGTHRLLSKDVKPSRLGLLIIDEEQRFGVGHKEKLKSLKAGVDVLTLTATPIPRTLHMSMLGLRDISIIATPPQDRLSVKTYVSKFDELLVRDAISKEVKRGGQVFFVHNRVEDIVETQKFLIGLCPGIEVRIAHGQMGEHTLEKVIVDFLEQKFPVLLCTTIIESGIDMPNVNTLIVDRADKFGLAQLYQIRGRVGRSSRQAYAYFLTPANHLVSEDAQKRLDVLNAHQDLGAGFQIASHDLELRGAGNLLGAEQSGRVGEVGLELYTQMLEEAILSLRGEKSEEPLDTEIKIPFSAVISNRYMVDEGSRLSLYKRLFSAESADEIAQLAEETQDRFGQSPKEMELLYDVARIKHLLRVARVRRVFHNRFGQVELNFAPLQPEQVELLLSMCADRPKSYVLTPDYRLLLNMRAKWVVGNESERAYAKELISLLDPLAFSFERKR